MPPGAYRLRLAAPAHVELAATAATVVVGPGGGSVEIPARHRTARGGAAAALGTIFP
jgi:hypothetical protein